MHICVYVCGCRCVSNAKVCWFFNVEFLRVRISLVSETVFVLYLLFHTDNILCNRGTVHFIKQGRLCPKTCCISIAFDQSTTVGTKWIQNPLRCYYDVPKSYQTEPGLILIDLPAADAESVHHYQMTLEMLVSLGSRGSMALLACASSRLCSRLFPGGLCPFSSVSGMLQ